MSVEKDLLHKSLSQDITEICESNLSQPYETFAPKVTYINGKITSHTTTHQSFVTIRHAEVR